MLKTNLIWLYEIVNFCQRFQCKKLLIILLTKESRIYTQCMLLHLCTTILKVDWPMIVDVQGLKEAKTKQIGIKLLFQTIRKWGINSFFVIK